MTPDDRDWMKTNESGDRLGPRAYGIIVDERDGRWAWRIENSRGVVLCVGGADYSLRKSAIEAAENCVVSIRGAKVYRAEHRGGTPDYTTRGGIV